MDVVAGHPGLIIFGRRDPAGTHERDQVLLHDLEVFELLVEMAGEQQHGVFQLAFAVAQRALAGIAGREGRADGDGGDQERAAQDQPADRAAAEGGGNPERDGGDRSHATQSLPRNELPEAEFSQPSAYDFRYRAKMELTLGSLVNGWLAEWRRPPPATRRGP